VRSRLASLLRLGHQYNEAAEIYKSLVESYDNGDPRRFFNNPYRLHYFECLRHLGRTGDIASFSFVSKLHEWLSSFVLIVALPVTGDWAMFLCFSLVKLVIDFFAVRKICAIGTREAVLLTLTINAISILLMLFVRHYRPSYVWSLRFGYREHLDEGYMLVAAMAIYQALCISLIIPVVQGVIIRYVFRYKAGLNGYKWFWFSSLVSVAIVGIVLRLTP